MLNKKFITFTGLSGFIIATILFTLFPADSYRKFFIGMYSFLAIEFLIFTLAALYLFRDRKFLVWKLSSFILLFSSTIVYLSRTFTRFGHTRFGSGGYGIGSGLDFFIGIFSFVGSLIAFTYFSFHSYRLYQSESRNWLFELIVSILILIFGFYFSVPGLSYGGLVLLPLGAFVTLAVLTILLIKGWKEPRKTFFFTTIVLLAAVLVGTGLLLKRLSECCH